MPTIVLLIKNIIRKKIKKSHFLLSLLLIFFSLLAMFFFELKIDSIKGEVSFFKKIYYQTVRVIPIKPAVKLLVPDHRQEHKLSCELASLRMALNYKGVAVTESELIQLLPISYAGPRQVNNIWGDPNLGFVGNIDGSMPNTGYGVYEQPIYDLASKYRSAKIITNGTLTDLITELGNDNPIVVWGVIIGRNKDISWITAENKIIKAQLDEHARVLIGFTGTSAKPEKMILLDPIYGEVRLSVKDFLKNWQLLENKAVVIY